MNTLTALKPLLTKKAALIAGGVLFITATTGYGIVRYEQAQRVEAAELTATQALAAQKADEAARQLQALQGAAKASDDATKAVCGYVRQLDANLTITRDVNLPPQCL